MLWLIVIGSFLLLVEGAKAVSREQDEAHERRLAERWRWNKERAQDRVENEACRYVVKRYLMGDQADRLEHDV